MTSGSSEINRPLGIIVAGASGDLAVKKVIPALFALFCKGLLPEPFHIVGYARTALDTEAFRQRLHPFLPCRYGPCERCPELQMAFLQHVSYVAGAYGDPEGIRRAHRALVDDAGMDGTENRIYYLSIPPFLFLEVANAIGASGVLDRSPDAGWARVVVEKPFGEDRASSDALTQGLAKIFEEDQTYRIDHYLGKEVIQNLMVLRFANLIFDPIWNRSCIKDVQVTWMEDLGLEGRAGYFDQYGIIRDVMQNHLLQILALIAMEPPITIDSKHVRDEKVKVLECIPPLTPRDVVVGQYVQGTLKGVSHPGYLEEPGVPQDSITPTFAAAVLKVNNRRWDGVPFVLRAGKGLNARRTEIRIRFRDVPGSIFTHAGAALPGNELVICVQPDAAIAFRIVTKAPGLTMTLAESDLDLIYSSAFRDKIPDAYECLLLDVAEGDRSLFIRYDELEAAWDVFTPLLHQLAREKNRPESYAFGSTGPEAAQKLAAQHGVPWD